MDRLPSRRVLVYLVFGCLVLVGGVWGLTTSGGSAGASEVFLVQEGTPPAAGSPEQVGTPDAAGSSTTETRVLYVQVAGAVRRPGVYQVPAQCRVFEALQKAGGASEEADEQALNLAAPLTDGARIYVPKRGEALSPGGASAPGKAPGSAPPTQVSLNAATQAELESLPGIGPATAQRIIAHREENGPFQSVDELDDVSGIGPALMERLRPLVVP
jgi:competence protein ComEA